MYREVRGKLRRAVMYCVHQCLARVQQHQRHRTNKHSTYRRTNVTTTQLLQKSDSIYRKYNISTTPIVIEEYKLVFFTCEKIGSTVIRQLLRRMMGFDNYAYHGGGIPHIYPKNGLTPLHKFPLEKANEMMTSDEWTRAMFMRDPKERALSGFLMWRPTGEIDSKTINKAIEGQIDKPYVGNKGSPGMLAACCRERANGDYNFEVLCMDRMRSFEGFLDMIEDPNNADTSDIPKTKSDSSKSSSNATTYASNVLRQSASCPDKHWSPITHWRMEKKFYPQINFIGHLETANWDIHRLMNRLHPEAWDRFGASGWGEFRNESMFQSSSTVKHAKGSENYLNEYYTSKAIEDRVERIYKDDYDNEYLELDRVAVGEAGQHYRDKFTERYINDKIE